jgi:hypothetical protein
MKLVKIIEWLRNRLKAVTWIACVALVVLVALDAIPWVVNKDDAHTKWEHIPGFWAAFGFLGCVVIILVSKCFGHAGIMKREDYYDE